MEVQCIRSPGNRSATPEPMQTWDRTWTDEALYAKYGITKKEQAYIESQVRAMNLAAADDE